MTRRNSFLEFFAGGGMARVGLGAGWKCLFANDVDPSKCAAYRANFGADDLHEGSIAHLQPTDLPSERADLAWASFPCQDLSLAGARSGIAGARSGLFFEFWRLMTALGAEHRAPRTIVIENVIGLLTTNGGADFRQILNLMSDQGYAVGATIIDAAHFTPQSRPRVFIVGFADDLQVAPLWDEGENGLDLPTPTQTRNTRLEDVVDWACERWDPAAKTARLLDMMSPLQRKRVAGTLDSNMRRAGAGFRRMRNENGKSVQRFEVRFDGLAGCLRTPAGGSSRQIIVAVEKGVVRTRLLNPAEAGRLMGLPDTYILPKQTGAALKLCGDGVCAPVVQWLAENVLETALKQRQRRAA